MSRNDIKDLLKKLNLQEIWENIDVIIESGINIDEILDLGEPVPGFFHTNYQNLLNHGVDPKKLFRINSSEYLFLDEETFEEIAMDYMIHGLEEDFIISWLARSELRWHI